MEDDRHVYAAAIGMMTATWHDDPHGFQTIAADLDPTELRLAFAFVASMALQALALLGDMTGNTVPDLLRGYGLAVNEEAA